MNRISTHVLDVSLGKPANNIPVHLARREARGEWISLSSSRTGEDGRCAQLLPDKENLAAGVYRLTFEITNYFLDRQIEMFFPSVQIDFQVREGESEFHIPLLLSPYGYTTYRGS
ncbi:MAG: hydroxyisourate hydrolase [Acidobacteriota bacterium]|nr:hydroxyisourate hydrolase [Acidobacteriota bacterium]